MGDWGLAGLGEGGAETQKDRKQKQRDQRAGASAEAGRHFPGNAGSQVASHHPAVRGPDRPEHQRPEPSWGWERGQSRLIQTWLSHLGHHRAGVSMRTGYQPISKCRESRLTGVYILSAGICSPGSGCLGPAMVWALSNGSREGKGQIT